MAGIKDQLHNLNMEYVSESTPFLIYLVLLMVCGLCGNSIVLLVYYKKFPSNPTRTFILAMCVCDMFTNVIAIITEMSSAYRRFTFYSDWACRFLYTGTNILSAFSCLVLVAVALERQKIVHDRPLAQQNRSNKGATKLCVCGGLALLVSVPRAVLFGVNVQRNVMYTCNTLHMYWDTPYPTVYNLALLTFSLLCMIIMSVCYARIALHLWQQKQRTKHWRSKTTSVPSATSSSCLHVCSEPGAQGAASTNDPADDISANSGDLEMNDKSTSQKLETHSTASTNDPADDINANSGDLEMNDKSTSQKLETHSQNENSELQKLPVYKKTEEAKMTTSKSTANSVGPGKAIPSRTSLMLFVLTVVFIINYIPFLVSEALLYLWPDSPLSRANLSLQMVLLRSYYINSAINPFVYSFFSVRFRVQCRDLFRKT